MAARAILPLAVIVLLSIIGAHNSDVTGVYKIIHSPKCTKFVKAADVLEMDEVPGVISANLGLPLRQDIKWNGLLEGCLFNRPKANVIISVTDTADNVIKIDNYRNSYTLHHNGDHLDADAIINNIEREKWKKDPLTVDFFIHSSMMTLRTSYPDLFSRLPGSLEEVRGQFVSDWFTAERLGSLNITRDSDLLFVGELYAIGQIVSIMKQSQALVLSLKSPDLLHFTITGVRSLDLEYGPKSVQVKDAQRILSEFIDQVSVDFQSLYNGNVVIQVLTFVPSSDDIPSRRTRDILQTMDDTANLTLNLAPVFTDMYAPIFNIILWVMIGLALAIFFVSYGMWNMDPGRDSLIYRMTSQRMKRE